MLPRERDDTNRNEVIVDNDTNDEGRTYILNPTTEEVRSNTLEHRRTQKDSSTTCLISATQDRVRQGPCEEGTAQNGVTTDG